MGQSSLNQIGNQFVKAILCSPLHGLLSRSFVVLTLTGRKSGKAYSTPVNYQRQGNILRIVSFRNRTWWRNLRGGAPLIVRLNGREVEGWGSVAESNETVTAELLAYLSSAPQVAKYFDVTLDSKGCPKSEDVAQAARTHVMLQIKLNEGIER
ncbi:MAG: nitroreductase family deazaflavin-dependent oxidoreductase [Chloroflexi bacterium]|nr:nitroreductase family deazaflavin-dependent oxidoreductase [Chloroflexota bacterium]